MTTFKTGLLLLVMTSTPAVLADIRVTPVTPTSAQPVMIQVGLTIGRVAQVESGSIQRTGENSFLIRQTIHWRCDVPAGAPRFVGSEFTLEPLAPGTYTVSAQIILPAIQGGCGPVPPIIESAVFVVTAPAVPTLDIKRLLLLAVSIAVAALLILKVRSG